MDRSRFFLDALSGTRWILYVTCLSLTGISGASISAQVVDKPGTGDPDHAARSRLLIKQLFGDLSFAVQMGQKQRTASLLSELGKAGPESPEFHYFRGLVHFKEGDRIKAVLSLRRSVATNSDFDPAWNALGLAFLDADRYDEAASSFLKALTINEFEPHYPYNFALALYPVRKFKQCAEYAEKAGKIKPNFSEAHYLRALCLLESGRAEESLVWFERARKDNPTAREWTAEYLRAAEQAGRENVILALIESGIDEPNAARALARVHIRYGEYDRAIRVLERVIKQGHATLADRTEALRCARRLGVDAKSVFVGASDAEKKALEEYDRTLPGRRAFPGRDSLISPAK